MSPTDELRRLIDEQAEDERLWLIADTVEEAYFQAELRRLHAAVESALSALRSVESAPLSEPMAWMTHHDEPMLFPTRAEAAQHCADDEQPIALGVTQPERGETSLDERWYQWLRERARQDTAYDRYGNGGHWLIGFHSKDGNQSFDAALDAALALILPRILPRR